MKRKNSFDSNCECILYAFVYRVLRRHPIVPNKHKQKTNTVFITFQLFIVRVVNVWNALPSLSAFKSSLRNVDFYPRDAMLARVIAIATCLSVRLSVRHEPVLCQNEESI